MALRAAAAGEIRINDSITTLERSSFRHLGLVIPHSRGTPQPRAKAGALSFFLPSSENFPAQFP
jgi:hypothetical protein